MTLLGTVSGFVVSVPGVILYKLGGSPAVLIFATLVFVAATVAGARLPVLISRQGDKGWTDKTDPGARVRPARRHRTSSWPSRRTWCACSRWPTPR